MKRINPLDGIPTDYYPVNLSSKVSTVRLGRPSKMRWHVLQKLRIALIVGCSEREACIFAGIHRMTLYRFQEENPDFCDQKEAWKCWLVIQARRVIVDAIHADDIKTSWRYLDWKRLGDFSFSN